jgi:hypothetical protein
MSCDIIQVTVSGNQTEISVVEVSSGIQSTVSSVDISNLHNALLGLQGGASGEYYHLSSDQYNALSGAFNLSGVSTGSSVLELSTNNPNSLLVPSGYAVFFEGEISAFDTANFKAAAWYYKCLIANKTGLAKKVGVSQVFGVADDSSGSWAVYINENTGVNYFHIEVKGENSTTIKWNASVETTSVF